MIFKETFSNRSPIIFYSFHLFENIEFTWKSSFSSKRTELFAWKPMVAAQRVSAAPIHLQRNEINDPLTLAMANHNGNRRVNGVCRARRMRHEGGEEFKPLLTLTYTYFGRTNERTNGSLLWSRGIVATLSQRRMRRATGVRDAIEIQLQNYFRGLDPRGQISTVWPACGHRATDPIARPSCNREKGTARGESVLIPRVG